MSGDLENSQLASSSEISEVTVDGIRSRSATVAEDPANKTPSYRLYTERPTNYSSPYAPFSMVITPHDGSTNKMKVTQQDPRDPNSAMVELFDPTAHGERGGYASKVPLEQFKVTGGETANKLIESAQAHYIAAARLPAATPSRRPEGAMPAGENRGSGEKNQENTTEVGIGGDNFRVHYDSQGRISFSETEIRKDGKFVQYDGPIGAEMGREMVNAVDKHLRHSPATDSPKADPATLDGYKGKHANHQKLNKGVHPANNETSPMVANHGNNSNPPAKQHVAHLRM